MTIPAANWEDLVRAQQQRFALQELARRELAARHLLDFTMFTKPDYQMGWFNRRLCELLDDFRKMVEAKARPRVMVFAPPRSGKTELVTRRMIPFCMGLHPEWFVINTTYGDELSGDNGRDVRSVIEAPEFGQIFPDFKLRDDSRSITSWGTTKGGRCIFASLDGALTGKGADVLIIDDPLKGRQQADSATEQKRCWEGYMANARTRLMPGGGVLFTQTLWSLQDTALRLLELAKLSKEVDQWVVYKFPAIAENDEEFRKKGEALQPERMTLEELTSTKATYVMSGNNREWSSLYQCNPVPEEGTYFKKDNISRTYAVAPEHGEVFVCLDGAFKEKEVNDQTALGAWSLTAQNDLVLLPGAFIGRQSTFETAKKVFALMDQYKSHMLVAGKDHIVGSIESFLKEMMRTRGYFSIEALSEKGDKLLKARSFQARTQAGTVLFPAGSLFEEKIKPELLVFPAGEHDDVVDLCALAARAAAKFFAPALPPPPTEAPSLVRGSGAWVLAEHAKFQGRTPARASHIPSLVPGR
jgi:predicted phage terminase large subunit-like protein